MKLLNCPSCKDLIGIRTLFRGKMPIEGDLAACPTCKALVRYQNDGSIKLISEEEMKALLINDPMAMENIMKSL
jgi:uncharacterized protein YbaR (Trm112 family)